MMEKTHLATPTRKHFNKIHRSRQGYIVKFLLLPPPFPQRSKKKTQQSTINRKKLLDAKLLLVKEKLETLWEFFHRKQWIPNKQLKGKKIPHEALSLHQPTEKKQ